MVMDVETRSRGIPSNSSCASRYARDGDADPAGLASRHVSIGVVSHLGRQVEGDAQSVLAVVQEIAKAPVRLRRPIRSRRTGASSRGGHGRTWAGRRACRETRRETRDRERSRARRDLRACTRVRRARPVDVAKRAGRSGDRSSAGFSVSASQRRRASSIRRRSSDSVPDGVIAECSRASSEDSGRAWSGAPPAPGSAFAACPWAR